MIITGEDVLAKPDRERAADLERITALSRMLRPECPALDVARLSAVNESGRALFYCVDGGIVGCAQLVIYPGLANWMPTIETVAVDPAFRRRGIARALVTKLIDYGKERKLWRIALLTEIDNAEARGLYKSLGFQEVELIRGRLPL